MKAARLLLLCTLLFACSQTDKVTPKKAPVSTPQPTPAEDPVPPEPALEPQPEDDPVFLDPLPPVQYDPPTSILQDDPERLYEETDPGSPMAREEQNQSLFETLTSLYGVRLPRSKSRLALETVIGSDQYTVTVNPGAADDKREFYRELIITVGKRDIYVNNLLASPMECILPDHSPCPADGVGELQATYQVPEDRLDSAGGDRFVIQPLLKILEDLQRRRQAVLASLSDKAAAWLLDCDSYTLAVDRDIPYQVIAQVVHTAGFADLTRVRLVTLADNDTLTYIPILSPRLDRYQTKVTHVVGDAWWQREEKSPTAPFAAAFLTYSASLHADTFAGLPEPELPACLPPDLAYDKALVDRTYAETAQVAIHKYIDRLKERHGVLLGLQAPPPSPAVPLPPQRLLPGLDEPGTDSTAGESSEPAAATSETALPELPNNRLLMAGDAKGGEPPADVTEETPEAVVASDPPLRLSLRPTLFVTAEEHVLTLRNPDGSVAQAVAVPHSQPETFYEYLDLARGWVVAVGADESLAADDLVRSLDQIRYRCRVYSMSGKCKRWEAILPHVVLFAAPANHFSAHPGAAEKPEPDPEPEPEPAAVELPGSPENAPDAGLQEEDAPAGDAGPEDDAPAGPPGKASEPSATKAPADAEQPAAATPPAPPEGIAP